MNLKGRKYMGEVWKQIKGYEGLYDISNYGRVRSHNKTYRVGLRNNRHATKKGKILKDNVLNTGYCQVALYKNKKNKKKAVHRLVGKAFVPNPDNKPQINHKDGNKQNNHYTNIEWVTARENQKHRFDKLGHESATKIKLRCTSLGIEEDSILGLNKILHEKGVTGKHAYSNLAKKAREIEGPFQFKGLWFEKW